jgi:hypothetical protein
VGAPQPGAAAPSRVTHSSRSFRRLCVRFLCKPHASTASHACPDFTCASLSAGALGPLRRPLRGIAATTTAGGTVARARVTYLSEAEKAFIHEQAVQVLEQAGVAYNTPQALDLVEQAGAEVDRERLTARLGSELIERCLGTAPREVLLAGRDPALRPGTLGRVAAGGRLRDGMATYLLRRPHRASGRSGTEAAALAELHAPRATRFDEIDVLWPSPQTPDVEPERACRSCHAGGHAAQFGASTCRTRSVSPSSSSPSSRCTRRRPARRIDRPPGLLGHQLHDRAAAARPRHDRGEPQALPKRGVPDLRAADAAGRHDRPDDGARHLHRQSSPSCSRPSSSSSWLAVRAAR